MSVMDAPDWEKIITLKSGGSVSDAPDWEYLVTGPAGTLPVTVTGASPYSPYAAMGMFGLTVDPPLANSSHSPTTGILQFVAFTAMASGTAKHIYMAVSTGHAPTANENFLALYDMGQSSAGNYTLLGNTPAGGIDTALASGGLLTGTLSSGVALTSGQAYAVALLINAGSVSSITSNNTPNSTVVNPVGTTFPIMSVTTATHTTLPSPVPWSTAISISTILYWFLVGP